MKLLSINAVSFGKLKDFTLEPQDGLNRYSHPNEYGKTTLIHFIYFMLFGYDSKRLKTYFPWSGEPMAGALIFEQDGKRWRIERIHPQKGAEKRKIFSPDTGEEWTLPAKEQPGPYFLKIDGETFLRTFCITQGDLLFARTDGLDVALKNMAATGDENVSFSQAEAFLHKQHTRYQYRGKTQGPLLDLKKELEQDRLRLSEVRMQMEEHIRAKEEWDRLEQDRTLQLEKIAGLQDRLDAATRSDALKKLTQLQKLRAQKPLEAPAVSREALAELETAFADAESARKAYGETAEETRQRQTRWELLSESAEHFGFHSMTASQIAQLQKGGNGFRIAALVTAVLGAVLIAAGLWFHLALLIAGIAAVLAAGMFLLAEKAKKDHICRTNGAVNPAQLLEKWAQYQEVQNQRQQLDLLRKEAAGKEEEARKQKAAADERLDQLKVQYRIFNKEELNAMLIQWGIYQQSLSRENGPEEQLLLGGRTEEELQRAAEGAVLTEETAEQVQKELSVAEERLRQLQAQKDALNTGDLAALWSKQAMLNAGIAEKEQQVALWEREFAAVQQSLLWLKAANEEMNTRFAPRLCSLAGEQLSALTGGKYQNLTLDEKYEIQLETKNGTYPLAFFSQGTRDAVYFAFRLAVGSLLSDTSLPLVLDDPFVNLDPKRKSSAETLLEKAAAEKQVLYFTCR